MVSSKSKKKLTILEPKEEGKLEDCRHSPAEQCSYHRPDSNTSSTERLEIFETNVNVNNELNTTALINKHPKTHKISNLNVTRTQSLKLDQFVEDKSEYNFPCDQRISNISSATQGNHVTPCTLPKKKRYYSSLSDIRPSHDVHNYSNVINTNTKLERRDCFYSGHDTKESDEECSCQMCSCSSCCEDCKCDILSSNIDISEMCMQDKPIDNENLPLKDHINSNDSKYTII